MSTSSAESIIFNVQTASSVSRDYSPTQLQNTFLVQQPIYVTYEINSNGQNGHIKAKWYKNGELVENRLLDYYTGYSQGFFSSVYDTPASGSVELYWCTTPDCSDAKLPVVANFTVIAETN